jgi:hypothetical protein
MKTIKISFLVFGFLVQAFSNVCKGQEYQKIKLQEYPVEVKANFSIWMTDYYICTGIAYAKSLGKAPSDFAGFVGNHHSWEGIEGKGLEPAVQIINGRIKLYPNGNFEITSESDSMVTMKSNRPYKDYFQNNGMLGVTVEEFESCLWGHIAILADRVGLIFKYKIVDEQVISSLKIKR